MTEEETNGYRRASQEDLTIVSDSSKCAPLKRPSVKHPLFFTIQFISFILICVAATSSTVWTKVSTPNTTLHFTLTQFSNSTAGTVTAYTDFDAANGTQTTGVAAAAQGLLVVVFLLYLLQAAFYWFFFISKNTNNIVTRLIQFVVFFAEFLMNAIAVGLFNSNKNAALAQAISTAGASRTLSVGSNCVVAAIFLDIINIVFFCSLNQNDK